MMEYREFITMTDDEIRKIVTDIFQPKKITCIRRHKREKSITCKIYTEWTQGGDEDPFTVADDVELKNPFEHSVSAISVEFSIGREDLLKLKQFCFAKGMCPWLKNNPYLKEEKHD